MTPFHSLTLTMNVGPMTLVLKEFCMSSGVVSCRMLLSWNPTLLISRLRPSVPTTEPTCWAHCFMLLRSVASDRERKKAEHRGQSSTERQSDKDHNAVLFIESRPA